MASTAASRHQTKAAETSGRVIPAIRLDDGSTILFNLTIDHIVEQVKNGACVCPVDMLFLSLWPVTLLAILDWEDWMPPSNRSPYRE